MEGGRAAILMVIRSSTSDPALSLIRSVTATVVELIRGATGNIAGGLDWGNIAGGGTDRSNCRLSTSVHYPQLLTAPRLSRCPIISCPSPYSPSSVSSSRAVWPDHTLSIFYQEPASSVHQVISHIVYPPHFSSI